MKEDIKVDEKYQYEILNYIPINIVINEVIMYG